MKFKIDENLPVEIAVLLTQAGHSALTVKDQRIGGSIDQALISLCVREDRTLVTLDLDFSDIRTYPPNNFSGIIVLRTRDQSKPVLMELARQLIPVLASEPLKGQLWIVEPGRIRIRDGQDKPE